MMMMLRSELGQIFSRLLHHQQRAIKSMIVCEQLAIATPVRTEKLWQRTLFGELVSFRF